MSHISKSQCKLTSGSIITGKWHQKRYKIIKELGYGATGYVYLASGTEGLVALKISDNSMAITSEVNVLRHFSKVHGSVLGPSLLDVDDWLDTKTGVNVPFYVMEYMQGLDIMTFLNQRGEEWFSVIILQLLQDLEHLHKAGWVFGDLKPDNLLVVGPPPKIRWFDVGGTTVIGRSIKEYTEFFDRGYWGLGSRVAEPSYDLFAVAMIMINTQYPSRFSKNGENNSHLNQLQQRIDESVLLRKYEDIILKALKGNYQEASEMRNAILYQVRKQKKSSAPLVRQSHVSVKREKDKKMKGVVETILVMAILLLGYLLFILGQFL